MNAVSRAAKPSVQGQADTTTSPDRQRRRFRTIRWLGAACVTAGVGIGGFLAVGHRDAGQTTARTEPSRHVNVVVTPARMVEFVRRLAVQGNLQAKRLAMVSPRMAGVIDEIFVDEGDRVEAGRTNLFQTDAVKLHKTVEVRTREVEVAQSTLREKEASLEKNQADFDKAEFDWKRYRRLLEDGATADEEVEEAHAEYRRCGGDGEACQRADRPGGRAARPGQIGVGHGPERPGRLARRGPDRRADRTAFPGARRDGQTRRAGTQD